MKAGIAVIVTPEDRRRLEAIVSDRRAPQGRKRAAAKRKIGAGRPAPNSVEGLPKDRNAGGLSRYSRA